ncbi:SDR family oxidoreductase [Actinoplanes sp. NPDC051851]|uniref:SDR family oxidoreductase n=1 Tax=Actinoplanes sp. NPDC051851 TaxID=3154753 RepID=UPI003414BFBF
MKIVVIGGTGLIGSRLIALLRERGHEAVAASPATGVDTLTGAGLAEVLTGARVVVDVSNSPSFADADVLAFFQTSGHNLLAAERAAGVAHHVALSVVGADRAPESGYLRAKVAQEELIRESGVPFTILRATQFFEFLGAIAGAGTVDGVVRVPSGPMQPVAADDVAATLAELAPGEPAGGIVELGGPDACPLDDLLRRYLAATGDDRPVVGDPAARYFGTAIGPDTLITGAGARIGGITLTDWLTKRD